MTPTIDQWRALREPVLAYLEALEVFFAPTGTLSVQERKHLEGCLARQLRERHPAAARFYPEDNRTIPRALRGRIITVSSDVPIAGLDGELEV